eukprot:CAMPEP_0175159600 /NCGR_PEP_ID=MMETSP0087-20121206/23514_1 /TAXON_ID=136419 /ORGANISM="Unknown Unknown, Strain D1" /LENGTH=260 /DNA_ID=CAMNT_0016447671 /DNA_START=18 /DNA_END=796 /DNA_ORIENTATION=+
MSVQIVPVLQDNYAYLLVDESTKSAAAVDPVEPEKVLAAAKKAGVTISTVLTTHSHWDHAGGNNKLKQLVKGVEVVGGVGDNAEGVTREVKEGDVVKVGEVEVQVLSTPCHTAGHVCYFVRGEEGKSPGVVFTGDTMFVGGCGNFNDGTPEQMTKAMLYTLGSLPADTLVYVGHEYTLKNFAFGLFAEPNNKELAAKMAWAQAQRAKGLPTVPSTIKDEWATNPFMRVREASIQEFTKQKDEVKGLFAVRKAKNQWVPPP